MLFHVCKAPPLCDRAQSVVQKSGKPGFLLRGPQNVQGSDLLLLFRRLLLLGSFSFACNSAQQTYRDAADAPDTLPGPGEAAKADKVLAVGASESSREDGHTQT